MTATRRWVAALALAATLLAAGCEKCFHRQPCGTTAPACGARPGATAAPPPGADLRPAGRRHLHAAAGRGDRPAARWLR